VFKIVVAVAFQSIFSSKMYQNNIYIYIYIYIKKLFLISAYQNDLKTPKNINLK
jgi:hypothetical protein